MQAKRRQTVSYPIAVIAGKDAEYDLFMHWVELSDRNGFVHVHSIKHVRGRLFSGVLRIGNYKKLPDHKDIYNASLDRVRRL